MHPTIGGVWAEIGAARRRRSGRGKSGRWSDRARGSNGRASLGGARSAGAVKAGREAAILVGLVKVEDKLVEGFRRFGFGAPVSARDVEESRGEDKVVAKADNGRGGGSVVASGGKPDAIVKLGEEFIDGSGCE